MGAVHRSRYRTCRIASHCVASHRIAWYRVASRRDASHRVVSRRVARRRRGVACPTVGHERAERVAAVGRARYGPDEVSLTLEGPEVFANVRALYNGTCVYRFPFRVTIPGVFRAVVLVTRTHWTALTELTADFPRCT